MLRYLKNMRLLRDSFKKYIKSFVVSPYPSIPVDGDRENHPDCTSLTLYSFSSQLEKSKMMLNLNRVYLFCQMWTL